MPPVRIDSFAKKPQAPYPRPMLEGRAAIVAAIFADLVDRLGRNRVLVGDDARRACGWPSGGRDGPLAVAMPANAEQVEAVVRIGKTRHAPVLPRLRLPVQYPDEVRDVLIVDCSGLQAPPIIDIGRRTATVGVGMPAALVDRQARQARLCLRTMPAFDDGARIGALVAGGDPGDLGSGAGSLLQDVVGAEIVTGGGRLVQLGAADWIGQQPWLPVGLGNPLGQLLGSEGRLGIVCSVTLRLHPAPDTAWLTGRVPASRQALLSLASLARQALSVQACDTVLGRERDEHLQVDVRVAAWDAADLPAAQARLQRLAEQHHLRLTTAVSEGRRVKLGMQQGQWPAAVEHGPVVDVLVGWPDVPTLWDVTQALYGEAGQPPQRIWSFGHDGARLRCVVTVDAAGGQRIDTHPIVARAGALFDAGAVPTHVGSLLRPAARERMPTAAKVLGAALQRAWDPEGNLAGKTGIW